MKSISKRAIIILALVASTGTAAPDDPLDDPTVRALEDELARTMQKLELPGSGKPYFVSFSMWNVTRTSITAQMGALMHSTSAPRRTVDIDLRVGDHTFDNTNFGSSSERHRSITLNVEPDYGAVRRDLWLALDHQYKSGLETLERKRAVVKTETPNPNEIGSFSKEQPSKLVATRAPMAVDVPKLEALAKKLSAVFRKNPDATGSHVQIEVMDGRQVFLSSEGSRSIQSASFVRIEVVGHAIADDGQQLHDTVEFWAPMIDQLPSETDMLAQVDKLSSSLSALRKAPVVDDFTGPIVFRGIAAGQVIRTLLSENFSGSLGIRPDRPGGTVIGESELIGKVGQRVLPTNMSVVDDPTITKINNKLLLGSTKFDDEGVPAQKVSLVEAGTLKTFLMSRLPRKGFEKSNGHASSTQWMAARAHPANLIVNTTAGLAANALGQRARTAAKDAGAGYYYVVDKLVQRRFPNDEHATPDETLPRPVVMRRVHPDGREELVRGGAFGVVSIRMLRDAIAGDTQSQVSYSYLGSGLPARYAILGGDSPGGYLATIVAPSFLLKEVDIKKPRNTKRRPPILPKPS